MIERGRRITGQLRHELHLPYASETIAVTHHPSYHPLLTSQQEQFMFRSLRSGEHDTDALLRHTGFRETLQTDLTDVERNQWACVLATYPKIDDLLVACNYRLVVAEANDQKYLYFCSLNDAISGGVKGVKTAIEKFDDEKDKKFSTYATWWIRRSIQDEICVVNDLTTWQYRAVMKKGQVRFGFRAIYQREPTDDELAAQLVVNTELSPPQIAFARSFIPVKE